MEQIKSPLQNNIAAQIQANVIETCDSVFWYTYKRKGEIITDMTFLKAPPKESPAKPTSLGYKYNILLFRTPYEAEREGVFTAIIGDPRGYAERMGKLGYHGIMLKQDVKVKKELKKLFETILAKIGFTDDQIKKAIKATTG